MKLRNQPSFPKNVQYALTVPQAVLFTELSFQANNRQYFKELYNSNFQFDYLAYNDKAIYWNQSDNNWKKTLESFGSLENGVAHFIETMGKTSRTLQRIAYFTSINANKKRIQSKELIEILELYWFYYKLHFTCLFTYWNVENLFVSFLDKKLKEHVNVKLSLFFNPQELNYYSLERLQLINIAKKYESVIKKIDPDKLKKLPLELVSTLKSHQKTFAFLYCPFNIGNIPSIQDLIIRIVDNSLWKEIERGPKVMDGQLLQKYPKPILDLIDLSNKLAFWKSERLDIAFFCDSIINFVYVHCAKALGISIKELFSMTSVEIIESLKKNKLVIEKNILFERIKSYSLIFNKDEINFYSTRKNRAEIKSRKKITRSNIITGMPVSGGNTIGMARVIIDLSEMKTVKRGDIIVTKMTRPEMGNALDKAAGFITDEGGMLCHAAIIAREMNKPCVVGTSVATTVLKTGDLIDLNGYNGNIKILEQI